jgi:hypothetical protein
MTLLYDALLGEILALSRARDSLPRHSHIEVLFEVAILRLEEQAAAHLQSWKISGQEVAAVPLDLTESDGESMNSNVGARLAR